MVDTNNTLGLDVDIEVTDDKYGCINEEITDGYIFIRGFDDHNESSFEIERELIGSTPFLEFDYNQDLTLEELSDLFIEDTNEFITENDIDYVVIFGKSAGGLIILESLDSLDTGTVEVHTLASPLNGYNIPESFVEGFIGIRRTIAIGLDPWPLTEENVIVVHHKTVEDESLRSWCEGYADICHPLGIQENNVPGATVLFYPEEGHLSIVHAVSELVIECHT